MKNNNNLPAYLSVKQIADMFEVNPRTVYRWIKIKSIPKPIKTPGGHLRWEKVRFLQFIEDNQFEKKLNQWK